MTRGQAPVLEPICVHCGCSIKVEYKGEAGYWTHVYGMRLCEDKSTAAEPRRLPPYWRKNSG